MRGVLLVVVVAVIMVLLVRALGHRPGVRVRRPSGALDDELVKDPVCQTYVVRSRAVTTRGTGGAPYFCSTDCARRYPG